MRVEQVDCHIVNYAIEYWRSKIMNELLERLNSIDGAYFDFVSAIEHYAKKKPDHLETCT